MKTAIVTGGASGIGRDISESLVTSGYNVISVGRGDPGEDVGFTHIQSDISEREYILREISKHTDKIDVLINNAGINKDGLLIRMKDEDIDEIMNVNLIDTIKLTRVLIPKINPCSSIIMISSVTAFTGNIGQCIYSSSKAGLIGFTRSLALEYSLKKIRVNAIAPGFIRTKMTESLSNETKEQILSRIPLKSFGETSDISKAISFIIDSPYITGQVIHINGGMYCS